MRKPFGEVGVGFDPVTEVVDRRKRTAVIATQHSPALGNKTRRAQHVYMTYWSVRMAWFHVRVLSSRVKRCALFGRKISTNSLR